MYKLVRNIHVHGPDIFGRPAQFHLFPNARKGIPHWTVRANTELQTRTITPSFLRHSKDGLCLTRGKLDLPTAENILPLAWFIAGVHIIQISAHTPHRMPGELLNPARQDSIRSACDKAKPRDWQPIISGSQWESSVYRNGEYGITRAIPLRRDTLEVFISIDHPRVGRYEKTYDLEKLSEDEAIRILSAQPMCNVRFPNITRFMMRLLRRPFVDSMVWIDVSSEQARQRTLEAWCDRRFVEILGAFSVLVDGYDCPAMRIESINSDSKADVEVAQRVLIPRPICAPTQRLS